MITRAPLIGRRGGGGGGSSCIIQEKPGGEWRRTLGAKRHMQTMPGVSEIQISLGDYSSSWPLTVSIWTNSRIKSVFIITSVVNKCSTELFLIFKNDVAQR